MILLKKLLLPLLGLVLAGLVGAGFWVANWYLQAPENHPDLAVRIVVPEGKPLGTLAAELEEKKLVRSAFVLKVYSQLQGTTQKFQRGIYVIEPGLSLPALHNVLTSSRQEQVTIPEGLTLTQIAKILDEKNIVPGKEFLEAVKSNPRMAQKYGLKVTNLEGFIFPDTYQFIPTDQPDEIIDQMVGNFFHKLAQVGFNVKAHSFDELYKMLILASIIEKEYRVASEAPLMASVFKNRLTKRIGLASCATIIYIITELQGLPNPHRLLIKDTKIVSPYNTYLYRDLPPGPISNPGLTALNAAVNTPKTDYLYFVLKNPEIGNHTFTKTYEEHNAARYSYLQNFVTK